MDSLPKLQPTTEREFEIGGILLKFRKIKIADAYIFEDAIRKGYTSNVQVSLYTLAHLLQYEATMEEKLEFITNLEVNGVEDLLKIDEILAELGAERQEPVKVKKNKAV